MLLLKLLLVPALVLLLTLAGRRWGPSLAGWLAGLPLVAGPTLLFVALDQGAGFAASAALAALIAVPANLVFMLSFAWAGLRLPWAGAGAIAVAVFVLLALVLTRLPLPPLVALGTSLVGLLVVGRSFPRVRFDHVPQVHSRWELPTRCVAAGALALAVTLLAERLGPLNSGLMAVFPVLGLVLGVFSHRAWGGAGAARLLAGMVQGMAAFTTFCFVLAVALPRWGIAWAFAGAVVAALLVQAVTFRRPPAAGARAPAPARAAGPVPPA